MESLTQKPTDLVSLTAEIKFYVQQWGQNAIEIGKRLIAAKKTCCARRVEQMA